MSRTLRLAIGLAALIAAGTILLWLPAGGAPGRPLRLDEAMFTAVSALTTTGLGVITPGSDLSTFGQVMLLLLMQVGGIGFTVGAVTVYRLLGRRVTLEERLSLQDSLGLVSTGAVLRLTRRVVEGVIIIETAGALLLWLNWRGIYGPGRGAFYAVFHSVAAFTNASFDLFSGAPDAPSAFPGDVFTLLVLSTLVILGSIGVPVLADLANWPRRRHLSLHSRLTLLTAAALLLLGTLALMLGNSRPGLPYADESWLRRLLLSYFHSATSRTSGFTAQPLETMAPGSILVLMTLMFIGGSPASMGGGIRTGTLAVLVLAMWNFARGRTAVRAGRRTIGQESVLKAAAILTVSLCVVGLVTWLLLITQDTTVDVALFETISAFATTGFSLGLTPRLDLFGRLLLGLTMFWGRLGALTVVVLLARREKQQAVTYPEEPVLIG